MIFLFSLTIYPNPTLPSSITPASHPFTNNIPTYYPRNTPPSRTQTRPTPSPLCAVPQPNTPPPYGITQPNTSDPSFPHTTRTRLDPARLDTPGSPTEGFPVSHRFLAPVWPSPHGESAGHGRAWMMYIHTCLQRPMRGCVVCMYACSLCGLT